jgi:hypothetical protein
MNADVTVTGQDVAGSAHARVYDIACFAGVLACAAIVAWMAAAPFVGHVPDQNAFYSADTGRVYAYLSGKTDGYFRMKVHPLYGWLCIAYQAIAVNLLRIPAWIGIPVLSSAISVTTCGLLYAVLRRFAVAPLSAASFVLLFCSSATYVFWSTLPETHMLAGASVLLAVLVMTAPGGRGIWQSAFALAIGCSMVVTDGVVWVLHQIDFTPVPRGDLREFLRTNLAKVRPLFRVAAVGVGIVYLFWAPEWPILGKRVGLPFNFLEERNYVDVGSSNSLLTFHIFGLTPPQIPFDWAVPLACATVTIAALWILRPQLWFVPLFALFGLTLHTVYSGDCAFLFSPDYMPMFIATLALVAKERLPKWTPGVVMIVALLLLPFNLKAWNQQIDDVRTAGKLMTFDTVTLH